MPRETDGKGNFKIYTFVLRSECPCSVAKRFVDYEVGENWVRRTTLELESATNYKLKMSNLVDTFLARPWFMPPPQWRYSILSF